MPASKAGKGDSTAAPTILCGWPSCNSWSSSVNGGHLPDDSKAGVTEGYGAGNTALIGSKWTLGTLTYSFPTSGTFYTEGYAIGTEPSEHVTFNAMQQDALRYALNLITRYTNLNFTEITESATVHANLRFSQTDSNLVGSAYGNFRSSSVVSGGLAADIFSFSTALGAGNIDRIADFTVVDDTIRLDRTIFTGLAVGALPGPCVQGCRRRRAGRCE